MLLNRERLRRAQDSMRERQRDLLFHVNHPILPGYVSNECPVGISDYRPTKRALHAVKKIAISFDYRRKALQRYDVYSLFMMGSSGTIAYSQASDFDIWVCHRPDMNAEQVAALQQKALLIERWADSLDLEVHFFLIPSTLRKVSMPIFLKKAAVPLSTICCWKSFTVPGCCWRGAIHCGGWCRPSGNRNMKRI